VPTRYEKLDDAQIDGVNRQFATAVAYEAGSVRIHTPNLQPPSFVTELGGSDYEVEVAPLEGDQWFVLYSEA